MLTMLLQLLLIIVAVCYKTEAQTTESPWDNAIPASEYYDTLLQGFTANLFKDQYPMTLYNKQNIKDVKERGFKNLQTRCYSEWANYDYEGEYFTTFLDNLKKVVTDCLEEDVAPIITWVHETDEGDANEWGRMKFVEWWTLVATQLRALDYRLSFNLFSDLGTTYCKTADSCDNSLRYNLTAYDIWAEDAINAIRNSGRKNGKRIIILPSPSKRAKGFKDIPVHLYEGDDNVMAEFYMYSGGPVDDRTTPRGWHGSGSESDRQNLLDEIARAEQINIPTYWGAWMSMDNYGGTMDQYECEEFAKFFVSTLKIPWSQSTLARYYHTEESRWRTEIQKIGKETQIMLNVSSILDVMVKNMSP